MNNFLNLVGNTLPKDRYNTFFDTWRIDIETNDDNIWVYNAVTLILECYLNEEITLDEIIKFIQKCIDLNDSQIKYIVSLNIFNTYDTAEYRKNPEYKQKFIDLERRYNQLPEKYSLEYN